MKNFLKNLFWKIFPPTSKFSNFVRSIYHFFPQSSIFINRKLKRLTVLYPIWLENQEHQIVNHAKPKIIDLKISFLLKSDSINDLSTSHIYKSLITQTNNNWELLVFLPVRQFSSEQKTDDFSKLDKRIKIITTDKNKINQFLDSCDGDYFVCCTKEDKFSKSFIDVFCNYFIAKPNLVIYYSDCEISDFLDRPIKPFFKPDSFALEFLIGFNFLSRAIIQKEYIKEHNFGVLVDEDFLIQEWNLIIEAYQNARSFVHIPYILHTQPLAQIKKRIIPIEVFAPYFKPYKIEEIKLTFTNQLTKINWSSPQPLVSIIIPTKNNLVVVRRLIYSLTTKTKYPNYEIIIVDNQSDNTDTLRFYEQIKKNPVIKIIPFNDKFNFSRANNLGVSKSTGDLLLFLNDDMEIIHPDWMDELVQWALLSEIGIVGSKLLFPSGKIQHAGVIVGMQGIGGHIYQNTPEHFHGLLGSTDWYRNYSAVTGACQMIRRKIFYELGGFNENYQLTFSDIDLCYKALSKGYRILYNPFSVLIHHQGKSRGFYTPESDVTMAKNNLSGILINGDPYYSKNLELASIPGFKFDIINN